MQITDTNMFSVQLLCDQKGHRPLQPNIPKNQNCYNMSTTSENSDS